MRVLIFGASGRCGQRVVEQSVAKGYQTFAVHRDAVAGASRVDVIQCDVLDSRSVASAIAASQPDAVVSCLGHRRRNPNNPWSAVASPKDLLLRATNNMIASMLCHNVGRIVAISAAGVADSAPTMSWPIRTVITRSEIRHSYIDMAKIENALQQSGLDWCAPRPVTLTSGDATHVQRVTSYSTMARITRSTVAAFVIEQVAATNIADRTPMIAGL
jgi:nucleoside-diphosphate-sugar epimerase